MTKESYLFVFLEYFLYVHVYMIVSSEGMII